jgi:hypothetical protein
MLRLDNLDRSRLSVVHRADKYLRVTVRVSEVRRNGELLHPTISVNNLNPDAAAIHVISRLDAPIRLLKCAKPRINTLDVVTWCGPKEPKCQNRNSDQTTNDDDLLAHGVRVRLTNQAQPCRASKREPRSGTVNANRHWLQRLVRHIIAASPATNNGSPPTAIDVAALPILW